MCGRYSMACEPSLLYDQLRQTDLVLDEIRRGKQATICYNMCPGRYAPVYRKKLNSGKDEKEGKSGSLGLLEYMKWGLIPSFSKDRKMKYATFNCRSDNLRNSNSQNYKSGIWGSSKKYHRCLVPAEGYYEWKKPDKIPYYIKRKDGNLVLFAGLWEINRCKNTTKNTIENMHEPSEDSEDLFTFTIITREARPEMQWLHDREPVMVDLQATPQDLLDKWLDPTYEWTDELLEIFKSIDPVLLEWYEVSKDVGKISNNSPELNKPISKKRKLEESKQEFLSPGKKHKQAPKNNAKITNFFKKEPVKDGNVKVEKGVEENVKKEAKEEVKEDIKKRTAPVKRRTNTVDQYLSL